MIRLDFHQEGKDIVISYDEDGSKWLFLGFRVINGYHYMKVRPHPKTLAAEPELRNETQLVELDHDFYDYIRGEVNFWRPRKPRIRLKRTTEVPLDRFIAA